MYHKSLSFAPDVCFGTLHLPIPTNSSHDRNLTYLHRENTDETDIAMSDIKELHTLPEHDRRSAKKAALRAALEACETVKQEVKLAQLQAMVNRQATKDARSVAIAAKIETANTRGDPVVADIKDDEVGCEFARDARRRCIRCAS
jgi:hypothetical protein